MIQMKDVVKKYFKGKSNEITALKGATLSIGHGEMVACMGASGSGKSTLLHIAGLLDNYESGEYFLDGEDTSRMTSKQKAMARNQKFGFVVQDFALIEEETVYNNVLLPLLFHKADGRKEKVKDALVQVGLQEYLRKKVEYLSGGEKQRVAVARALVNQPGIILADEPTGSLDSVTGKEIIKIFQKMKEDGKTVVIVTHDKMVSEMCDRTVTILDGVVYEDEGQAGV